MNKSKKRSLGNLSGFINAIKGEQDSDSREEFLTDEDDVITDEEFYEADNKFKWVQSQASCQVN